MTRLALKISEDSVPDPALDDWRDVGSGEAPERYELPEGVNGDFAGETDHPADPTRIQPT